MKALKEKMTRMLERFIYKHSEPPSPYEEAIARWATASIPKGSVYSDIREIEVYLPTIDQYCEELQRLTAGLKADIHYRPPVNTEVRMVRVLDFYLSKERHLLDVPLYYDILRREAMEVLALYQRRTREPNLSGSLQSTLYNAGPLIKNLMDLSQSLSPD